VLVAIRVVVAVFKTLARSAANAVVFQICRRHRIEGLAERKDDAGLVARIGADELLVNQAGRSGIHFFGGADRRHDAQQAPPFERLDKSLPRGRRMINQ
jgi:hypothetical protein